MILRALRGLAAAILGVAATLIGVILVVLVLVATTETGLRVAWSQVQSWLPDSLSIESVEGRLIGPLIITGVEMRTDSMHVQLDRARLAWRPGRLFSGLLAIDELALRGLDVTRLPAPEEPEEPFSLPDRLALPLRVRVERARLEDFAYRATPEAEPFVIDRARLSAAVGPKAIELRRIEVDAPLVDLRGQLRVAPAGAWPVDGELRWTVRPPDYAPAEGVTALDGSLQELHVHQTVAAPYNLDARVTLFEPLEDLRFRARAALADVRLAAIGKNLPKVEFSAEARAEGTPDDLRFDLRVDAREPQYGPVTLDAHGAFRAQVLHLKQLLLTRPDSKLRAEAGGRVSLAGATPELDLELSWQALRWPLSGEPIATSPSGRVQIKGTPARLSAQFRARLGDRGRIEGSAERDGERLDVALDWRDLSWPILTPKGQPPRILSPTGSARVQGVLEDYTLSLDARVDVPEQTGGRVTVAGHGDLSSMSLEKIEVRALKGRIDGQARVQWKPAVSGQVSLTGEGVNPGVLLPEWPGSLGFEIQARGGVSDDGPRAHVERFEIDGSLRELPLQVSLRADYDAGGLELPLLEAHYGATEVSAQGRVGETLDLTWALQSDDLSQILDVLGGRIEGEGRLAGTREAPRVQATVSGAELRYAAYTVAELSLAADVDLSGATASEVDLQVQRIDTGALLIESLVLQGEGRPRDHALSLRVDADRADVELAAHGDYHDRAWFFRLESARLAYAEFAPWSLAAPVEGVVAADRQRLDRSCWTSDGARLCLAGERTPKAVAGQFELSDLPFTYFQPLLPPDLALTGELNAQGEFSQDTGGLPRARLNVETTAGEVATVAGGSGEAAETESLTVVRFQRSTVSLTLDRDGLDLDAAVDLVENGRITAEAHIPGGEAPLLRRPLSGRVQANIDDIGFVADLVPEIEALNGRLEGDLRVEGTLAQPRLRGRLLLADASASLISPGLEITDIRVELAGAENGVIDIQVSAHSGGGSLSVDGSADFTGDGPRVDLAIRGNAFQVYDTDLAQVWISPELEVNVRDRRIEVTGEVRVPRANISPEELPESAVTVSGDQVIVRPGEEDDDEGVDADIEAPGAWKVYARVRLILGDDVQIDAFGLTGRLDGSLLVVSEPGEPTTASGELNIEEGEYQAYGQGLVIERGRILFPGGPITEPGLDVLAVRRPEEDITVGVQVRGSLTEPEFTLFSDPAMTQAEQLSWLVLGKPLDDASGSEGSLVNRAALALGLKGGEYLTDLIGSDLGFDTFGIQSGPEEAGGPSDPEQAALVIGKYLSPDLYVSYGIGLFEPVSTVTLQYTLSSKWKLETQASGTATGGDLIYTIERGGD